MIIFLYGLDTYRSRQKLDEIIASYKKANESRLNLRYFEGKEADFDEIRNEIQQTSIISGKKLLILKNIFTDTSFKEKFVKNSRAFISSKDIIIFYEEKDVAKSDALFKLLKKSAKYQEFKSLDGQNLSSWIKKEFDNCGAKIETGVAEKLINFAGADTWRLSNEILKLIAYKKGKTVNINDVELLVKPKIDADIFKTIDALAKKDKKQALNLLHKHLQMGDNPLYLLSMINFQFRNLISVKSLADKNLTYQEIQKKTKLHPFVVKKSLWQAREFTFPELKKIYQNIFKVDVGIKTGKLDPVLALDLFISEI
jgi:DNA polymerase-3 subunit delta